MPDVVKTITIPEALVADMIGAFGSGWVETVQDENGEYVPNPQSKAAFANQEFNRALRAWIRKYVYDKKLAAALATVSADFSAIID